jgi:hypothetical protein
VHQRQRSSEVAAIENRTCGAHNLLRIENGYMVEQNKVGLSTLQAIYTV